MKISSKLSLTVSAPLLGLTAALLVCAPGAELWGRKPVEKTRWLSFMPGATWSMEETVSARVPDPETGGVLTPTTRARIKYEVVKVFSDGAALVSAKVTAFKAGRSPKRLTAIPASRPPKPLQYLLMSPQGRVYGPFDPPKSPDALKSDAKLKDWLSGRLRRPWIRYKLPRRPLAEGKSVKRRLGRETWKITRKKEESVGGRLCEVYEAVLIRGGKGVWETLWIEKKAGLLIKREVREKNAKNVSSTLTQVRL